MALDNNLEVLSDVTKLPGLAELAKECTEFAEFTELGSLDLEQILLPTFQRDEI